ncbi:esterase family protein [Pseudonocardia sp. GCM10023141]|uniref:esterase family protein n=1 Tax=Pseudonocardia sp. GCM10023141 TaxID=3252653 RepID=UPI003621F74F
MRRRTADLWSPALGRNLSVVAYGHYGRPVLAFPAENGSAVDLESHGLVDAVADAIDGGQLKLYCVDSIDGQTWSNRSLPLEERARRHDAYESWIVDQVVGLIHEDCGGPEPIVVTGPSLGAFHAANIALRRADLFPRALCLSGNYDPASWHGWGERGEALYFHNPIDYVANLHGEHLDWLRAAVALTLVCGQGMWEDTTGALPSTRKLAELLGSRDIPHELDLWGNDVAHDWPWWQRQFAHHLPRITGGNL